MKPNIVYKLLLVSRPKTLLLAISPVILAHALVFYYHAPFKLDIFIFCLLISLLLQITVNIHNDYSDFLKGADNEQRIGPMRLAQSGLLSVAFLKRLFFIALILSIIVGSYLVYHGGWIIFVLAVLSILSCYAYTGGAKPIAYSPFGELFVLFFFGIVAVNGSYYLQTQGFDLAVFLLSIALGLMASQVLTINNYRDIETDRLIGKKTLAVVLGRKQCLNIIVVSIIITYSLVFFANQILDQRRLHFMLLFSFLALFFFKKLKQCPIDKRLNRFIALAGMTQFVFAMSYSLFLII